MHHAHATAARLLILTGLYLAGAAFALHLIEGPGEVALFWPASGLAMAVVVRYGPRWWLYVLGANLLMHALLDPVPWSFLPFSALSNALGALLGGCWVRHRVPQYQADVSTGLALLQGGLLMGIVSAAIGATGLSLSGLAAYSGWGVSFVRWAMGDFLSVTALSPLLLWLLSPARRQPAPTLPDAVDFASLGERSGWLSILALSLLAIVAGAQMAGAFALAMVAVPLALLLWSAMRFPPVWTLAGSALGIVSLTTATAAGVNGFPQPSQPLEVAILLAFLSLIGIAPMLVMAGAHERRLGEARLLHRARTDSLTGLPNRTAFEDRIADEPDLSSLGSACALAYIDLDHFTLVNDTASHAAGDALIKSIASLLRARLHERDELYRIGGDEFTAIFHECRGGDARSRAEGLLGAIDEFRLVWGTHVLSTTASIGLALFDRHDPAHQANVLAQADAACFTAKEMGGAQVCLAAPGAGETFKRTEAMYWALRIRDSLDHHRFELYCQGISPLAPRPGGNPAGRHFEVLLRLNQGPELQPLLPGEFIPAAERFGLCVRIDREVVAAVLDWLDDHPAHLAEVDTCAINLTADALMDESFAGFLAERLHMSRVQPHQLCFEITETSAVYDLARAQRFISRMRLLGCRFALDDFGTGFSSFGYLRSLDVDFIKIDGSFVREMQSSALATAVIRSITDIARVLNVQTVAEHTESEQVCAALRELGVDHAQGFALHQPEPIADFFRRPAASGRVEAFVPEAKSGLL